MADIAVTKENELLAKQGEFLANMVTLEKGSDTKTPVPTTIRGTIPKWLSGNLYRNGPGVYKVGDQRLQHIFDGLAVIHRFSISDGDVTYQTRILDSDTWVSSCKANRLAVSQFSTFCYPDPCRSLFDKLMSYLLPVNPKDITDNTSVHVVEHGDKLYAMGETQFVNEIDPKTLTKKSQVDLYKVLSVHLATAHPHFDTDGTMYNLATGLNPLTAYNIVAIPAKQPGVEEDPFQKAYLVASVPARYNMHIAYNHSFGMSQDHFVVLEQPLTFNTLKIITTNWRRDTFSSALVSFPDEKLVFRVVQRSSNKLLPMKFETDTTFCLHFISCYEDEGQLVVDICGLDELNFKDVTIHRSNLSSQLPLSTVRRYILPINAVAKADPEVNLVTVAGSRATAYMLTPGVIHCTPDYIIHEKIFMDLPRINYENYNGKKYRYAYGTSSLELVKVDFEQRKALYWNANGFSAGEPIFIPKPDAIDEDDGVLLSPVMSLSADEPSYLVVLDAKSFTELGRAIAPHGVKMSYSFHGTFVPSKK